MVESSNHICIFWGCWNQRCKFIELHVLALVLE
jgi:hypothetical protein